MEDSIVGTPIELVRVCDPNPSMVLNMNNEGVKSSEGVQNNSSFVPLEHPLDITLTPFSLPDVHYLFIHVYFPPLMYSMKTKPITNYSIIYKGNSDTLLVSSIYSMNATI